MDGLPIFSSESAAYVIGPQLVGWSLGAVLTGVVGYQFVKYLSTFPEEPLHLRAYVVFLIIATLATAILDFMQNWYKLILGEGFFGHPDLPIAASHSIIIAFITFYVQAFYLHRLYLLSKHNWPLVGLLATLLFAAFALSLTAVSRRLLPTATDEDDNAKSLLLYNIHIAFILVGDILLTLTTVGYLVYYRKQVLPLSAGLFTALIRATFQSAAPATLCIIIQFALSLTYPNPPFAPFARVSAGIGLNMVLSKLWAMSLLGTLNSRAEEKTRKTPHGTSQSSRRELAQSVYVNPASTRPGNSVENETHSTSLQAEAGRRRDRKSMMLPRRVKQG
ncbi:hypothetical protein MIND_01404200 [Mycena indigotica]|uniref:Uncharacterized protein n=1 Tax=Mycena indigotica TaxID=2126181 RepID=A0A8H6RXV5_9AGAR|nr:uncharacterized protein MIND_01404200 [Mycena indigotica]KAF7288883.1 hypothetical protein MIND_01404200 [Mycena indigotica]